MLRNGSIARSPLSPSMKAAGAGWMSLNSSRSPKRLKPTLALCFRTYFTPTSHCPLRFKVADQGMLEHKSIRCPPEASQVGPGASFCHALTSST